MDRSEEAESGNSGKIDPIILAVDCCNLAPSAALIQRGAVAASGAGSREAGSIESILEICRSVFQASGSDFSDISDLAVSIGPGSFTGIRTAIGTIEGLAAGLNLPVCGIALPLAIAIVAALRGTRGPIVVYYSANPNEDFAGWYRIESLQSAENRLLITPLTPIGSFQKGSLQSSAAAGLAAEFFYIGSDSSSAAEAPLIEAEKYLPNQKLSPAAAIGLAASAVKSKHVAVAEAPIDADDMQLQFLRSESKTFVGIAPLYGKPVNAKTLVERGKIEPGRA